MGGTESTPTVPTGTQPAGPRFTSHGVRGRNHQVATEGSSIHSMRLARGRSRRATLSTPARSATLGRELRALPSTLTHPGVGSSEELDRTSPMHSTVSPAAAGEHRRHQDRGQRPGPAGCGYRPGATTPRVGRAGRPRTSGAVGCSGLRFPAAGTTTSSSFRRTRRRASRRVTVSTRPRLPRPRSRNARRTRIPTAAGPGPTSRPSTCTGPRLSDAVRRKRESRPSVA